MNKQLATILIEISEVQEIKAAITEIHTDSYSVVVSSIGNALKLIASVPMHITHTAEDPDVIDDIFTDLAEWDPQVDIQFGNYVIN